MWMILMPAKFWHMKGSNCYEWKYVSLTSQHNLEIHHQKDIVGAYASGFYKAINYSGCVDRVCVKERNEMLQRCYR